MHQGTSARTVGVTANGMLAPSPSTGNAFFSQESATQPRRTDPISDAVTASLFAILREPTPPPPPQPAYLESWAAADYGQELQKPYWTVDEAPAILLGVDPFFGTLEDFGANEFKDQVAGEGMRLRRLILRAQYVGDLGQWFRPRDFINWALRQHITVPLALLKLAVQRGLPIIGYPSPFEVQAAAHRNDMAYACEIIRDRNEMVASLEAQIAALVAEVAVLKAEREACQARTATAPEGEQPLPSTNLAGMTRSYNKACVLLCVVARVKFRIEFSASKQPSLGKMVSALSEAGVVIDDETLRKYLLNGAEQLARQAISPA